MCKSSLAKIADASVGNSVCPTIRSILTTTQIFALHVKLSMSVKTIAEFRQETVVVNLYMRNFVISRITHPIAIGFGIDLAAMIFDERQVVVYDL